ncbi:hypothetical protein ADICYQ_1376 [Cyclobacterium qasimii M12-11B]|uniref:Uncharacterized protein n=1 Tax=Cyclobacterium qasimii M12-11B TaxID=641524 RepID=S7VHX4_9BACT|nr:hypothetical protein ADICYQ_1376 [Cyclobacterium qasimii M12-11B]
MGYVFVVICFWLKPGEMVITLVNWLKPIPIEVGLSKK